MSVIHSCLFMVLRGNVVVFHKKKCTANIWAILSFALNTADGANTNCRATKATPPVLST